MNGQINLGQLQPVKYFICVAVIIGFMFAFISPDDDLKYGWLGHAMHWQFQTVMPMLFAILLHHLISRFGLLSSLNAWITISLIGFITGIVFTPIAYISDRILSNEAIVEPLKLALWEECLAITPPILVFWVAVNAPLLLSWRLKKTDDSSPIVDSKTGNVASAYQPPKYDAPQTSPTFYDLVPEDIQGDLILLKSELHYLLVVTEHGKSLILYSLKNAINELHNTDGFQPHRSYWVNKAYIDSIKKNGREGQIIMKNGSKVPVSRQRMQEILNANMKIEN